MGLFRLLARTTIGLLFVGHGTQKLFGWFGGGGLDGTGGFFEQLGLRPGRRHALAAGAAEAGGGLLFALGAATPLGAAAVSGSMITAIKTVHWECEACGWVAVTEKYRGPALLAEHRKVCPNKAEASEPASA
jgi:uncharacterized membrane protein YphA (DoxX/SURF4 family)